MCVCKWAHSHVKTIRHHISEYAPHIARVHRRTPIDVQAYKTQKNTNTHTGYAISQRACGGSIQVRRLSTSLSETCGAYRLVGHPCAYLLHIFNISATNVPYTQTASDVSNHRRRSCILFSVCCLYSCCCCCCFQCCGSERRVRFPLTAISLRGPLDCAVTNHVVRRRIGASALSARLGTCDARARSFADWRQKAVCVSVCVCVTPHARDKLTLTHTHTNARLLKLAKLAHRGGGSGDGGGGFSVLGRTEPSCCVCIYIVSG